MYCLLQPFYDIPSAKLPYLEKMPDTGLSMNLKMMLDTAVTNCTVKSIYEEHGGMTFKIRFNSIENGHTWQAIVFIQPGMEDMSIIVCAFKVLVD